MGEDAIKQKGAIKELKYAKEHLIRVMNMDFERPKKQMK